MSGLALDLLLLVALLGVLEALLLAAHALRRWAGLYPVCLIIALFVFFMMLMDPLGLWVAGPWGLRLYVNSMTLFPTVLLGVLLVYITEGTRPTWILMGCVIGVYGLVVAAAAAVQLWIHWPGLSMEIVPPAEMFPLNVGGQIRSAAALVLDVAVLTGLFWLLARRHRQLPVWCAIYVAFAAALITDGIVYPLLNFTNPMAILQTLPGQAVGKLVVAVVMSLPLILYLKRVNPRWLQEEAVGARHFDLFEVSGDLRRSLQLSERRFHQIIDQSRTAIIGFNSRGRVILWNRAAEEICGLSADRALGRPVAEFLSEGTVESLQQINRIIAQVFAGETFEGDMEITRISGERRRHLVGNQFPLRGAGGEVLLGIATLHDITQMREAERALAKTNERLEVVLDSIREGMASVDRDGVIRLWNQSAAKMTGLSSDDIVGTRPAQTLPTFLGAPTVAQAIDRALRLHESVTLTGIRGPGASAGGYEVRLFPHSDGVSVFFS